MNQARNIDILEKKNKQIKQAQENTWIYNDLA